MAPSLLWQADFGDARIVNAVALPDGNVALTTSSATSGPNQPTRNGTSIFSRIFPHYYGALPELEACTVHVLDSTGRTCGRWKRMALAALLSDGTPLGVDRSGVFRWRGASPEERRESPFAAAIGGIVARGNRILLVHWGHAVAMDELLNPLATLARPSGSELGEDGLYWIDGGKVWRSDWSGLQTVVAELPLGAVAAELQGERERSGGKLAIGEKPIEDLICRELNSDCWVVSTDADSDLLFLCNRLPGFTIVAIDRRSGRSWVRCVSPGCCGHWVQRLANGDFVASSGCGGTVTWLNRAGDVLAHQAVPTDSPKTVPVIGSQLQIGPDDSVYAERFGRVFAYGPDRALHWSLKYEWADRVVADPFNRRVFFLGASRQLRLWKRARLAACAV